GAIGGGIILAAGDQAAALSYGTGAGQTPWLILGGSTATGGDINIPNVSLVTNGSLIFAETHSGYSTGSITTGAITAANGTGLTNTGITGSTFLIATGNVATGTITSTNSLLFSIAGSIGSANNAIQTNVQNLSILTPNSAYIYDSSAVRLG